MKIFNARNARVIGHTTDTEPHAQMQIEADEMGDQYHTIKELYQHRMALNLALFHALDELYGRAGISIFVPKVYKSKNHHPDSSPMFEGYFIVFCIGKDGEWTSYHYDLKHWDEFKIREAEYPPPYPVGHEDSIEFFSKLNWK